jgi:hypothetical protein
MTFARPPRGYENWGPTKAIFTARIWVAMDLRPV